MAFIAVPFLVMRKTLATSMFVFLVSVCASLGRLLRGTQLQGDALNVTGCVFTNIWNIDIAKYT